MNNASNRRANNLRNTSKYMGASKIMDVSNSRADNRRNTFNSMDANNIMDQSKSMDATGPTEKTSGYKFLKLAICTR